VPHVHDVLHLPDSRIPTPHSVPIALYLVFTINLGIGLDKGAEFGDVFVGPKFDEQKILSWISGISALALTLFGFCWQMPALISAVYGIVESLSLYLSLCVSVSVPVPN
jgi:hypothetical protein